MKRLSLCVVMVTSILISTLLSSSTMASEDIFGLRIDNINRNGADFYWSTSIVTMGSIEYAHTKLSELYNPQLPGSQQNVLVGATPLLTKSEERYGKTHHIKVDNLDINEDPFIQYTIKSQAFNGELYSISGEFVLVDTQNDRWWQTWQFAIFMPLFTLIIGLTPTIVRTLKKKAERFR